jgi:hypothetical protein
MDRAPAGMLQLNAVVRAVAQVMRMETGCLCR